MCREGDQGYNIWYGKHRGENWNEADLGQEPAENKCVLETDGGMTAADGRAGSGHRFFCIQFCRGKCARAHKCTWFHRIPTVADDGLVQARSKRRSEKTIVQPCQPLAVEMHPAVGLVARLASSSHARISICSGSRTLTAERVACVSFAELDMTLLFE